MMQVLNDGSTNLVSPLEQTARNPSASRQMRGLAGSAAQAMDMVLLSTSLVLAIGSSYVIQALHGPGEALEIRVSLRNLICVAFAWCGWSVCLWSTGMYHLRRIRSRFHLCRQILIGTTLCTMLAAAIVLARDRFAFAIRPLIVFWLSATFLMILGRSLLSWYVRHVKPRFRERRTALIVGTGPSAQTLAVELMDDEVHAYDIFGFVDSGDHPYANAAKPAVGKLDELESILMTQQIDEVFVALPVRSSYDEIERVIKLCESMGVQAQYLSDSFRTSVTKARLVEGENANRIVYQMVHHDRRRYFKRALDILVALIVGTLLAPVMLVLAILVKVSSPGPIFFGQLRYGLNRSQFRMWKFRSMVVDAEQKQAALEHLNESAGPIFKIKNDPRITRIGAIMRKTSLDELPQLYNVLRGEMSLVGPRPLPMRDVSRFSESSLMRRFSVKPGMTGLWQVSGRSNTSFTGWITLDLHYIDHWSLTLDTKILLKTIFTVVKGTGAA